MANFFSTLKYEEVAYNFWVGTFEGPRAHFGLRLCSFPVMLTLINIFWEVWEMQMQLWNVWCLCVYGN